MSISAGELNKKGIPIIKTKLGKTNQEIITVFIDINTVPQPTGGEEGYVLEVFNVLGESIDVVIVPQSAVSCLQENQILTVRSFVEVYS